MVQVLPQVEKESFASSIGRGLGARLSQIPEQMMMKEQQKAAQMQKQQEDQAFMQLTGMDISGVNDPKMREKAFEYALQNSSQEQLENLRQKGRESLAGLQGQKQMELEKFKQESKQNLQKEKQSFLGQMFGGNKSKQPSQSESQQFDPSQISDADILQLSSIDPVLGREARMAKDTALKEKRFEKEFSEKQRLQSPEHRREQQIESSQAQADVKYNQTLQEASKQHELKEQTLERLDKLNKKGVTGKPYEKILEKMGLVALTSEGRREFAADVKNLITDIRSILGAQFTGFEFQTILNAYPNPDFSKEANSAIIKNLKDFQEIKKKEVEFAEKLKKENKGKIPFDFQSKVNDMVREYASTKLPEIKANTQKIMAEEYGISPGNILMLDPQGEPLDVSPDQVEYYESLGASLP